jgi:hypothetical protein
VPSSVCNTSTSASVNAVVSSPVGAWNGPGRVGPDGRQHRDDREPSDCEAIDDLWVQRRLAEPLADDDVGSGRIVGQPSVEVGDPRVDHPAEAERVRCEFEMLDRHGRHVEGHDVETAFGEPERLVAEAAGEVDGEPGAGYEFEEFGAVVERLRRSWFGWIDENRYRSSQRLASPCMRSCSQTAPRIGANVVPDGARVGSSSP